jgi:hypothetical protein
MIGAAVHVLLDPRFGALVALGTPAPIFVLATADRQSHGRRAGSGRFAAIRASDHVVDGGEAGAIKVSPDYSPEVGASGL